MKITTTKFHSFYSTLGKFVCSNSLCVEDFLFHFLHLLCVLVSSDRMNYYLIIIYIIIRCSRCLLLFSLFVCSFVCLFVRMFVCLFVHFFVRSYVCVFVCSCLFVCLFVCLLLITKLVVDYLIRNKDCIVADIGLTYGKVYVRMNYRTRFYTVSFFGRSQNRKLRCLGK
jgi:hypothetical protein